MTRPDPSRARPVDDAPGRRIWIDGRLVPWAEATVHVLAHSHQRGSLVFDYMSVHETRRGPAVFRLDDHLARLFTSVELVGLPLARTAAELRDAVLETVAANPGAKAVKVSAYLPSIEVDVVPADPHVAVAIAAYDPKADVLARKARPPSPTPRAVRIWLEKERRQRRPDILHPHAKVAGNYTSPMFAKWEARRRGYDEVLLVDDQGRLAEGPTTNFFLVDARGRLCTPPEQSVLLGVTRRSILEIARAEGLDVVEEPVGPEDLFAAREAFLTGTTAGVWPIASVDDRPVGEGEPPGPVSRQLGRRFRAVVSGDDPGFEKWLTYVEPVAAG
ncbi:MAG: aminotransferase class IV [Myxococcota bacterium]|nr:aminotransferase class IV [Myxococcota bacterium]